MGSFTGSKGLHFYFFGSFASILSLYTLFEPSLCNYNYTLVLVMFPFEFVTISYLDKFFLPASKLVWCQIIVTLLYFFGWNIFLCLTLSHASTFGRDEIMSSSFLSRCFKTFLLFKYFVLLILQFDVEKILVCKVELSLEKMPMYMKFWVYYAFFFFFCFKFLVIFSVFAWLIGWIFYTCLPLFFIYLDFLAIYRSDWFCYFT